MSLDKNLEYLVLSVVDGLNEAGIYPKVDDLCKILFFVEFVHAEAFACLGGKKLLPTTYILANGGARSEDLNECLLALDSGDGLWIREDTTLEVVHFGKDPEFFVESATNKVDFLNLELRGHKAVVLSLNRDFLLEEKIDPATWYREKWYCSFSEYLDRCFYSLPVVKAANLGDVLLS